MKKLIVLTFLLAAVLISNAYQGNANPAPMLKFGGQTGGAGHATFDPCTYPCYVPGQIMSTTIINYNGYVGCSKIVHYLGGCQTREQIWYSGTMLSNITTPGGCGCCLTPTIYHPQNYPNTPLLWVTSLDTNLIKFSAAISLKRIDVWNLVDSGQVVYSRNDSLPANQVASIPKSVFSNGGKYLIVGYTQDNNADAYMALTRNQNSINSLKRFCSWGTADSSDVIRECITYISNDSVMVYIQKNNKTGRIYKGTHNVTLPVIKIDENVPDEFGLAQNYPNPFNPVTKINFSIPKSGLVKLQIFDCQGKEVKVLVNEIKEAGYYIVDFNGSELSSGVYFYMLSSNEFSATKKMILMK